MINDELPSDIELENAYREGKGRPPMSADEIRTAEASAGALLLEDLYTFLGRFVAYPSEHAHVAHVLWIAHTHLMDVWESTPRIAFLSPEPGSGKTRALEVSELLVPRPVEAINATPAYLFRRISDSDGLPTILFDEIDTLFGAKAREHEEIRGVLNAGHRRGAVAGRCVMKGKDVETEELPAYCAVAVAGLGNLPDTLLSRCVAVRMRRRAPTEEIEPFRRRIALGEGHELRGRLSAWADAIRPTLGNIWPAMPDGIADRDADVWEALLAVADAAGGQWPTRARVAAVELVEDCRASTPSLGVRLLADLRLVFGERRVMSTAEILSALCELEEAPWADLRGRPLDARHLAGLLRPYGIRSKAVRVGSATPNGYAREDLHDSWTRYLLPPVRPQNGQHPQHEQRIEGSVGDVEDVERLGGPIPESAANGGAHCGHCKHFKRDTGENGIGTCLHFNVETWPEPNASCSGYAQLPGESELVLRSEVTSVTVGHV